MMWNKLSVLSKLAILPLLGASLTACGLADNGSNDGGADSNGEGTAGGTGSGDDDGQDTGAAGQASTIYEVQKGEVPEGTIVQIDNVVVTSPVLYDKGAVFVQHPEGGEYSGIYLYMYSEVVDAHDLQPGDVINLRGEYTEFYDMSEITVRGIADIEKVSSGEVPSPAVVNPADVATGGPLSENYESVLVRVENVECTNPDLGHGEFQVAQSLTVTDFFMGDVQPKIGDHFDSITGPLIYGFEEFKVAPRTLDDLAGWQGGGGTGGDVQYETVAGIVPMRPD